MRTIFLIFLLLLSFTGFAQVKSKSASKTTISKTEEIKPADGFVIEGDVKGFADGTSVALLNGQSGAPENETTITKNKFTLRGKVNSPDFKIILFNKQPPYLTVFLDNSTLKITGDKNALDNTVISGSPSHRDYDQFNRSLAPYQKVFAENSPYDSTAFGMAKSITQTFVKENPASFIAPLSIIRFSQLSDDPVEMEAMYNQLATPVRNSPMAQYVAQQIAEAKKNAIGSVLPDFVQADTTGKPVSLASYRGKYVLIDFWASWCRPCRQENPNVVSNYNKFKDRNFTVLGVSLDKAKPAWIDAINMDGLTWGHVSDLQGWTNSVAQQFQIQSIPQNFLIGPDGKIIGKNLRGPALERKLSSILK